jgi:hypothetical protein
MNPNPSKKAKKPINSHPPKRITKKDQILRLYTEGIHEVEELARRTQAKSSYIASILQREGLVSGYFDLYTPTSHPMNVYSKFFSHKLGFKDEDIARESVAHIDHIYHQFELSRDPVGQHHALMMALTMFDRARWTHKIREASVFRDWLIQRLEEINLEIL